MSVLSTLDNIAECYIKKSVRQSLLLPYAISHTSNQTSSPPFGRAGVGVGACCSFILCLVRSVYIVGWIAALQDEYEKNDRSNDWQNNP